MNISVLGCGRWGAFLAWYLGRTEQHNVLLYGRERSWRMAQLRETRKNDLLDTSCARATLTSDIHKAVDNSEILLISIGVQSFRGFLTELSCCNLSGKKLVLCMKGLEAETGLRLTEIVRQELGAIPCAVWVGPGHVQDFLRGIPNCMVIDSRRCGASGRIDPRLLFRIDPLLLRRRPDRQRGRRGSQERDWHRGGPAGRMRARPRSRAR